MRAVDSRVPDLLPVLLLGLVLGMRHATDADHVVAITTIVTRHRSLRRAALVGAVWGAGHTVTVFVAGGAIILLRLAIPPRVGLALELLVAIMLITLGALSLRPRETGAGAAPVPMSRPLLVGVVHGLAGSAGVALLVVAAVPQPAWAAAYLLVFGAGTVTGMMAITSAIAAPVALAAERATRWNVLMRKAAGVASIAFGVFLAARIGLVDGLFSLEPQWMPK